MNLQDILPFLNIVAIIAVALAMFYNSFRSGAKTINTEVLSGYERLDKQQKDKIAEQDNAIAEIKAAMKEMEKRFIAEIATLNGKLTEKNRQLSELQVVLANRDPALQKLLVEIRDFMKNIHEQNLNQTEILKRGEIRGEHQVAMIESQVKRERLQDSATASGDGKGLKNPHQ